MSDRKVFSICIPAYNRAKYLSPLLDSIYQQNFTDFEIVICEDVSPERAQISEIVRAYQFKYPNTLYYYENNVNLGYDGNIRQLVERAAGQYCFFMGNDDLMAPDALSHTAELLHRHANIGMVLKSYLWFEGIPENVQQVVRYFSEERVFQAGEQAITTCFRRSGVISGYIIHRDKAYDSSTNRYDGTLFYQMNLTVKILKTMNAVFTPKILVLCRNGELPDFGNSESERGKYVPGSFTAKARLNMVGGALSILKDNEIEGNTNLLEGVMRDYANYFYPCIKDQLNLPLREYWRLYRGFGQLGFDRYPIFHFYSFLCYLLKEKRFDALIRVATKRLGRSPQLGTRQ